MNPEQRQQLWNRIVTQVTEEFVALPATERQWLDEQLRLVAGLQRQIHDLFETADGARICTDCLGGCCGHGSFHFNLANLLGYLVSGTPLFTPDFNSSCPYIGPQGCRIPVELRPFNCVTFICELVEANLSPEELKRFYSLEQQLRQAYLAFDQRYRGSSLHGLLQRGARLQGAAFLQKA